VEQPEGEQRKQDQDQSAAYVLFNLHEILAVALDVQHRQEQGSRTEVVAPLDGISLLALIVLDNLRDP